MAAEAYRQLGLRLTYYPDKKVVRAAAPRAFRPCPVCAPGV
jgi:hypothetical protein